MSRLIRRESQGTRWTWMTAILLTFTFLAAGCAGLAKDEEQNAAAQVKKTQAIFAAVLPAAVRVEYTLRMDKGESPGLSNAGKRCPNCGQYHGSNTDVYIKEDRPLENGGWLLSPTRVITSDLMAHPRFIEKIMVRKGEQLVSATPVAYAQNQKALILELAEPLTQGQPLTFDAAAPGPYQAVSYDEADGEFKLHVKGMDFTPIQADSRTFIPAEGALLFVTETGKAVGMGYEDELPIQDTWKGSPDAWPLWSAQEMQARLAQMEERVAGAILRVRLNFRSPQATAELLSMRGYRGEEENNDNATEMNLPGVLIDPQTLLVVAELSPKITARLEKARIITAAGEEIPAAFAGNLRDLGLMVLKLEKALPVSLGISATPLPQLRHQWLYLADVRIKGEQRISYLHKTKLRGFETGWKRHLLPTGISGDDSFLLDAQGQLVCLPLQVRKPGVETNRWENSKINLPAQVLAPMLANLEQFADRNNIPLSEEEENRLAWLGVELQPLSAELARANKVSDQTEDGQYGAMITYIYPGSPAEKAGLTPGDILIRFIDPGQPMPLKIQLRDHLSGMMNFPWEQLDKVPEQYFDRIPTPWPPVANTVNEILTEVGFGKQIAAEVMQNGVLKTLPLTIEQGPAYYDSAAKFKSEALGVTVRDLTYEVRRYFQKEATDAGVIISRIESGSKASVAGIKPFEIISAVNDQPIQNVKDFEVAVNKGGELRLAVTRMNKGRTVKVKLADGDKPASPDAPKTEETKTP